MGNMQKANYCTNEPLPQTFRSCCHVMLTGAGHADFCNVLLIIYLCHVGRTYC
jgi:hypothetical protein